MVRKHDSKRQGRVLLLFWIGLWIGITAIGRRPDESSPSSSSLHGTIAVADAFVLAATKTRTIQYPTAIIHMPTMLLLPLDHRIQKPKQDYPSLLATNGDDNNETEKKKKKKKKSKRLVINPNLDRDLFANGGVATITSDGVVKVQPTGSERPKSSKLGVPTKPRKDRNDNKNNNNNNNNSGGKRLSAKALKLQNQRTAGGRIDSSSTSNTTRSGNPKEEGIRICVGKRGAKVVTMIQGMTLTSTEDRKKLLKELKSKVGGGGTLVDGVLELQGSHSDKALEFLKAKGYNQAKIVGGGGGKKKE